MSRRRRASAMDKEDRISSLPDGVISHILSLLATEEAVATSVLSKRWYPLWRSVTELDFSDEYVPFDDQNAYFRYKEFVLSVLLLRDTTQPIKSFSLKQQHYHDYPSLNKWVSVILKRGVEYLDLEICNSDDHHKLPDDIFTCSTLVALYLHAFHVNDIPSVKLPLLKILHLNQVQFTEYGLLPELLSRCPNLEEFFAIKLRYVKDDNKGNFTRLRKLANVLIEDCGFNVPLEALYDVKFLTLDIPEVSPHYDHMPVFYNMTRIKLPFHVYRWEWLVKLLTHCPKLQALHICQKEIGSNPAENWVCPSLVPECVSLHLRECTVTDYRGIGSDLQFAKYILQNANVLRTMTIESSHLSDSEEKLQMLQKLSLCLRSSAACKLSFT